MSWFDKKKAKIAAPAPVEPKKDEPAPKAVTVKTTNQPPVHIEGTTPVPVSRRWRRYHPH